MHGSLAPDTLPRCPFHGRWSGARSSRAARCPHRRHHPFVPAEPDARGPPLPPHHSPVVHWFRRSPAGLSKPMRIGGNLLIFLPISKKKNLLIFQRPRSLLKPQASATVGVQNHRLGGPPDEDAEFVLDRGKSLSFSSKAQDGEYMSKSVGRYLVVRNGRI
ncbi:hypothetical protein PVAP13_9KG463109 [Panicum virgatum]|uniref:Uncharacterized protein n=1 Tax=Panicum virgatum TaxID=38727 RepID=A0A8T0NA37_PANVG|nr:hypothetical protein PVAP13_9KG463109 [Panicum virgatum]